jgi:hypothetical protein
MIDDTSQHVGDRLDPSMRMKRETAFIILPIAGAEMIEQQEWIEIIEGPSANASLQSHPSALYDRLRLDDAFDFSLSWIHGCSPRLGRYEVCCKQNNAFGVVVKFRIQV